MRKKRGTAGPPCKTWELFWVAPCTTCTAAWCKEGCFGCGLWFRKWVNDDDGQHPFRFDQHVVHLNNIVSVSTGPLLHVQGLGKGCALLQVFQETPMN